MAYLPRDTFEATYPTQDLLGKGAHSQVYRSGAYAIKVIEGWDKDLTLQLAINEINLYTQVTHPCVVKLNHWTLYMVHGSPVAKLALPLGEELTRDTIEKHGLSFEHVASDILSGLFAIHQAGFAHNDIKPTNCVYLAGRVQLIDLGSAAPLTPYLNDTVLEEELYTPFFRDIQAVTGPPQSIRLELYAVGATLYTLFENPALMQQGWPISQHTVYRSLTPRQARVINYLTFFPVNERLTLSDIFAGCPELTLTQGKALDMTYSHGLKDSLFIDVNTYMLDIGLYLLNVCAKQEVKVKVLFATLTLFRRVFAEKLALELEVSARSLKLTALTCLVLASNVSIFRTPFNLSYLIEEGHDRDHLCTCIVDVMQMSQGVISMSTPWTHARNLEELPNAFLDLLSESYDPTIILGVDGSKAKDVSTFTFLTYLKQKWSLSLPLKPHKLKAIIAQFMNMPRRKVMSPELILTPFEPPRFTSKVPVDNLLHWYNDRLPIDSGLANIKFAQGMLAWHDQVKTWHLSDAFRYQQIIDELKKTDLGRHLIPYF